MARIFTTPEAEMTAKVWLHDVTLAAGIRTNSQRGFVPNFPTDFVAASQKVCDELINRDFENVDSSIRELARYRFNSSFNATMKYKSFKPEQIAKCLVYMAELTQLYWDDTIRTPYEIDEFKKTLLGTAVYHYKRNLSAISSKGTKTTTSTSTRTPGQPPKNNYKQSGPQSANVRDLQGTPGQKVTADTSFIYKIIGDNPQSKNTPNVFIKPLSATGAEGSTNKIFISSGNGYTDCTCYFDDPNDATTFLNKIIASNKVPANVTNLRVVKNKADPNGYFLVGTEFGVVAVSAKTLNEALTEAVEEKVGAGWEKATANYSEKELNELHTWMRRG